MSARHALPVFLSLALAAGCAARAAEPADSPAPPWAAPPLERAVSVRDGHSGAELGFEELCDRLAQADVVFLGETHLDETTHRVELAIYEGLLARRRGGVVLSLEMFERDVQPLLDAYLAGTLDEAGFLEGARPWSNYLTAYRPLVERARAAGGPVVAANFPTPLRRRMAAEGDEVLQTLAAEERALAPAELLPSTPAYWRRVDNAIRGHAAMLGSPEPAERLTSTQSLWDNAMGEACAQALAAHPGSLVLHVNGGFHSAYWDGAVRQLRLRAPDARVATVAVVPTSNPVTAELGGAPSEDFVVFAEERASDVSEGAYGVFVARKLPYRLHVPETATDAARVPLLLWLSADGLRAEDGLALWKERLGGEAAIAVLEAPYSETQADLVPGGRWFRPETFAEDVGLAQTALERAVGFVLRHFPVDPARVVLAGEGAGATVAAASAVWSERLPARALAFAPRGYAKLKEFPLPLPELRGDDPPPGSSLRVHAEARDADWWRAEVAEYAAVGVDAALAAGAEDPWLVALEREQALRAALGLAAAPEPPADAPRRHVVAEGPRAELWARLLAQRAAEVEGALVAVLAEEPAASSSRPLPTTLDPEAFRGARELPRCPGAFGGTTVLVVPAEASDAERAAWLALEGADPIAAASRFHRLRVATLDGPRDLVAVLDELRAQNRTNVLVVPATFCADEATLRALRERTRAVEERLTLHWLPGLGG